MVYYVAEWCVFLTAKERNWFSRPHVALSEQGEIHHERQVRKLVNQDTTAKLHSQWQATYATGEDSVIEEHNSCSF